MCGTKKNCLVVFVSWWFILCSCARKNKPQSRAVSARSFAVRVARTVFHLPYFNAGIELQADQEGDRFTRYVSHRTDHPAADLIASYRPEGPVFHAVEGTLEYFLTERYCLYAIDRRGGAHICEIHHPRWPLQVASARFEVNTLLQGIVDVDPLAPALLHFSKRQDTINWRPGRV